MQVGWLLDLCEAIEEGQMRPEGAGGCASLSFESVPQGGVRTGASPQGMCGNAPTVAADPVFNTA